VTTEKTWLGWYRGHYALEPTEHTRWMVREAAKEHDALRALNAELIKAAQAVYALNEHWDDDEEPETSDGARSRNKQVRAFRAFSAALAKSIAVALG
jgi:hypothetical protein